MEYSEQWGRKHIRSKGIVLSCSYSFLEGEERLLRLSKLKELASPRQPIYLQESWNTCLGVYNRKQLLRKRRLWGS